MQCLIECILFIQLWSLFLKYTLCNDLIFLFCRKELNLLQKLYGLYDTVMSNISGYYEILWGDVDIEKINAELQEFQNR